MEKKAKISLTNAEEVNNRSRNYVLLKRNSRIEMIYVYTWEQKKNEN